MLNGLVRPLVAVSFAVLISGVAHAADPQWTTPTAEELTMKSIPQVPGAGAVILYREEITTDLDNSTSVYMRIKILNESGKDYATIQLPYGGEEGISFQNIAGRTIHSDGTIIPFTGKPFDKFVEKDQGYKYKVKIFSLPSVDVGSIIEYRFKETGVTWSPDWYVQGELFTLKAHYGWVPVSRQPITWTAILPHGTKVERSTTGDRPYVLDVSDVPPLPQDEMMPPLASVSYRVLFYFSILSTADLYWKFIGSQWTAYNDTYLGPGKAVRAAVAGMFPADATDDVKLHKIYEAVMLMENSNFTRRLTEREAKVQGQKHATTADEVFLRRRGTGNELTMVFVSMARAAGLKAYVMRVADRSERLFVPSYFNFKQVGDYIAIVKVGGVDTYFDPGQRYTAYGHLAWFHAPTAGQRQTDTGVELASTPASLYKDNRVTRVADLTLDDHGQASGKVTMTYEGDSARRWRQRALLDDAAGIKADLKADLEGLLPSGMEVEVDSFGDLTQYDQPFKVEYLIRGGVGSAAGKRLLLPANLFQANAKPRFVSEKRDVAVDMRYAFLLQDAVRYTLPAGYSIESTPEAGQADLPHQASFNSKCALMDGAIAAYRNLSVAQVIFPVKEYPQLREFYGKLEAKDQETIVLTRATAAGTPSPPDSHTGKTTP